MKELIIFILFIPSFAADFSWDRDHFMPLAAASYSDNPSKCWTNIQNNYYGLNGNTTWIIYRQYTVKCNSLNGTCFGYIAIDDYLSPDSTYIYIVFRGTNNNYQFIENGWNYNEMVPFVGGGKVGKVFFDGFNEIWNAGMKDDILTLKNKYPNNHFYFLGHSIGGAMAALARATFSSITGESTAYIITFGQPRVGNKDFANAMNDLGYNLPYRFVHKADIVPHLPPLDRSVYYHFDSEFWYKNDMDDTIPQSCYDEETDPWCSNSLPDSDYKMIDHKYYFGQDLIKYGKNGCPDLATSKNVISKI